MGNPSQGQGPFTLPGESGAQVFTFEDFGSLNTKANRPAIDDKEFAWNENWLPIGAGNLRTLWAEGPNLYTATKTVIYDYPFNFGTDSYIAVFYSDGTADQVSNPRGNIQQTGPGSPTGPVTITPISSVPGTFYLPGVSTDLPQAVQWQAKYLVIVGSNTNLANGGYNVWDGTNLYGPGQISPEVTLTNSGAQNTYTSPPTITAFGGSGSGATFSATLDPTTGTIDKVTVTNPGSGYKAGDVVQLSFSGGGGPTVAQAGPAILATTNGVSSVIVTNGGSGYTTASTIAITGGGGSGAEGAITGLSNGTITQITIVNSGTGYTSQPTITASGAGVGFVGSVQINGGQISAIPVRVGGSGYTTPPTVTVDPPQGDTLPLVTATAHAVISSAGVVTSIVIDNPGIGYTAGKPINVTLAGGNNAASGTVSLMPFGIYGNSIETYQNSIFVANKNKVLFTAPGTLSEFASSLGGGSFIASDNFLRFNVVSIKQATGFLYLLADSSINVLSNLQTSVTNNVANTTFNNSNVDPQIGCSWRDTAVTFGRALMFANPTGVYALYGGAAQKVSQQLDGLFANADWSVTPTAAINLIYGVPVFLFSFRTRDPFQGQMRTMMFGWDGQKWFAASQIKVPSFLSTQEINSQLTTWGTDGTNLFPLFQTPSDALTKTFQTKLRTAPAHIINKQVNAVYVSAQGNPGSDDNFLKIGLDTEAGQGPYFDVNFSLTLIFVGSGPITFVGTGPITWIGSGLYATWYAPMLTKQSTYGRYLGFTTTTTSEDITLQLLSMLFNTFSPVAP